MQKYLDEDKIKKITNREALSKILRELSEGTENESVKRMLEALNKVDY